MNDLPDDLEIEAMSVRLADARIELSSLETELANAFLQLKGLQLRYRTAIMSHEGVVSLLGEYLVTF